MQTASVAVDCNDSTEGRSLEPLTSNSLAGASSGSYPIVDTNQTICFNSSTGHVTTCSGIGHDADYSGNQPNYTVSGDGLTVTDNVTGLVWQQSSDINDDGLLSYDDKLYQSEAVSHCEGLVLSGRDDWRLPSIKEAYSLILFSGKDPSSYQGDDTSTLVPFLDSVFDWAFGDSDSDNDRLIDGQYASSTLYLSTTMNGDPTMFGVNYVDGRIKGYPTHTKEYYVRCVTGNTSYGINAFVNNGDDTVGDNATRLMWQQDDTESTGWDDAVSKCEAATTASHDDWRLPNAKELHSIVDYSVSPDTHNQAAIDTVFNTSSFQNEEGETDWGYYWSSTTHVSHNDNGSNAAYLSFGRALGYVKGNILDVHGAGAQRSNDKVGVASEPGAKSAAGSNGTFYYKGPQGDILRDNNKVRCVRDNDSIDSDADGIPELNDNCPSEPNPGQENLDGDALGDVCDPDVDGDLVLNDDDDDDDNDGMDDTFELANLLNPYDSADAGLDPDDDGLTSLEEFNINPLLDPNDPDYDGDGIDDGLDTDPVFTNNDCTGADALFTDVVTTDMVCGADSSITLDIPAEVQAAGSLLLISPNVIFLPGFSTGGQMAVQSTHPCAACGP